MQSLFDNPDAWRTEPANAFAAFVLSPAFLALSKRKRKAVDGLGNPIALPPIRNSSAKIYILMFGRFLRWLSTRNQTLFDLTSTDLMAFLEQSKGECGEKVLNSVIRFQYLNLLERVYLHLGLPNPAQDTIFSIFKSGNRALLGTNDAKVVLTDAQQALFMRALPPTPMVEGNDHHGWKHRRDRAMQAMMLGAGLKVSEVIGVQTADLGKKDTTGSVPVTISTAAAGSVVRPHRTQLRPFAVAEVLQWHQERNKLKIPGSLLFPATLDGGRLNKATVYRQVRATFARAGIDVPRQGGRTLRNAFAVRELKAGESIELVGEFLGHRERRSTEAYSPDAE